MSSWSDISLHEASPWVTRSAVAINVSQDTRRKHCVAPRKEVNTVFTYQAALNGMIHPGDRFAE